MTDVETVPQVVTPSAPLPRIVLPIRATVEMDPDQWEDLRKALCDYAENAYTWCDSPREIFQRMEAIAHKLGFKGGMFMTLDEYAQMPERETNTLPKEPLPRP